MPAAKAEIKVNICDGAAIKRVLDDAVVSYLVQDKNFTERLTISNWKLALSFASCLLALIAQFYPAPFPDNFYVLLVCCSFYFACSGILQYIAVFLEQDFIFFGETPGRGAHQVQVRSKLPRFESDYVLTMSVAASSSTLGAKLNGPVATVSTSWSVGAFFDSTGVFVEHLLRAELDAVLTRVAASTHLD